MKENFYLLKEKIYQNVFNQVINNQLKSAKYNLEQQKKFDISNTQQRMPIDFKYDLTRNKQSLTKEYKNVLVQYLKQPDSKELIIKNLYGLLANIDMLKLISYPNSTNVKKNSRPR